MCMVNNLYKPLLGKPTIEAIVHEIGCELQERSLVEQFPLDSVQWAGEDARRVDLYNHSQRWSKAVCSYNSQDHYWGLLGRNFTR